MANNQGPKKDILSDFHIYLRKEKGKFPAVGPICVDFHGCGSRPCSAGVICFPRIYATRDIWNEDAKLKVEGPTISYEISQGKEGEKPVLSVTFALADGSNPKVYKAPLETGKHGKEEDDYFVLVHMSSERYQRKGTPKECRALGQSEKLAFEYESS